MKKILAVVLALLLCLALASCVEAQSEEEETAFVKVKIPFPDDIKDNDSWMTYARYKDTKEAITLSGYYEGCIWATIPAKNREREIEAFVPEEKTFTDIGENSNSFDILWLSRTGIIEGNDKGEAEPLRNVTRAEAVAMIMRFMGIESDPEANQIVNFSDVSKNDWFYPAVMSAYKCGIVKGDSENTFAPQRAVTHEEVVVMLARALEYADLRCIARGENDIPEDWSEISDWAKEAFDYIGAGAVYDYEENAADIENPKLYVKPKTNATRIYTARLLNGVQGLCQLYPSEAAEKYGFDKQMPIIDGSTSTYPFTEAVYSGLFYNGRSHKDFPVKHSKSHASYERLIAGEVDMLFASVYPASDILKLAEEKGVELELIPIAYDAMIFFTNADNPATGLTKEQITDIYVNNAYKNWSEIGGSDALLYPYCRNNDSGSHAQMEKHFLNGNEIHPEVQKETSYTMSNVLTDVMGAQTENPTGYGLGYSIYYFNNMDLFYDTKTELKLLEIDGVAPNDETIASGEYPLSNNTYIVLRKDEPENSPARKMAEFMLSEEGQECVTDAGYGKLKTDIVISGDLVFADKMNVQMPEDKNYMFSPISVKMALALAANGASGETQEELLNALGLSSLDEFNSVSKDLIERYSQTDILSLNIANSVWVNKDKTSQNFSKNFKKTATDYYNADVKTVNNKNAMSEINSWVSNKTNKKITVIVKDTDDFWAMLVNAIYFKGAWQNEFSESATKPDEFTSADGTKTQIDFMNRTGWMSCAETKSAKIVELPYKNRLDKFDKNGDYIDTEYYGDLDVSMYVIDADDINVAEELEAAIADKTFKSSYIKLSMPKFKIEYSESLNDMLKNIGIQTAFKPRKAQFENMFASGNMWFSDTFHKTFISVDEKGTEAAAVTAIGMGGTSLPPKPTEVKFNKPFYFVIRDNTSGEILFMGRYAFAE